MKTLPLILALTVASGSLAFAWSGIVTFRKPEPVTLAQPRPAWLKPGEELQLRLDPGAAVGFSTVDFTMDGSTLVTGGLDGTVRFWKIAEGSLSAAFAGQRMSLHDVARTENERLLATAAGGEMGPGEVLLRDLRAGGKAKSLGPHPEPVSAVVFVHDGRTLVSGCDDKQLRFWETRTGRLTRTAPAGGYVYALTVDVATSTVIGATSEGVRFWSANTGVLLRTLDPDLQPVTLALSPERRLLLVAGGNANSGRAEGWNIDTGRRVFRLETGKYAVGAEFAPDQKSAAIATRETVQHWDLESRALIRDFRHDLEAPGSVAFSQDGRLLAAGYSRGLATVWNVRSGRPWRTFAAASNWEHENSSHEWLAVTADGRHRGSDGGRQYLSWLYTGSSVPAESIARRYWHPRPFPSD